MKRILCIWFPRWPVQRILAEQPEHQYRAVVVYLTARQGQQVLVCNDLAEESGVQAGMPLAEVHSLPALRQQRPLVRRHDPQRDRTALQSLAWLCEKFSPLVGLDDPDSLLLDVTGLERLFRGERNLAREVIKTLQADGYRARVAIADTPIAAWAMAHYPIKKSLVTIVPPGEAKPLLALPLAGLRLSETTQERLYQLGLTRIGELARMNRASLKARFGPEIGIHLDRILGVREEIIFPERPASCLQESWTWEYPTTNSDSIKHVLKHLFQRLAITLQAQQQGCLEFICRFDQEGLPPVTLSLQLFQPTASAQTLWELLQLQLERQRFAGPVSGIQLTAAKVAPLAWRQYELFADSSPAESNALAGLINRLSSRLGQERVARFQIRSAAVPEHACSFVPAISMPQRRTKALASRFAPAERPLWLYSKPRPLFVRTTPDKMPVEFVCQARTYSITALERAERIESAWWRGRMVRRDYYRVLTNRGQRFWLFQRLPDQRWFLHGEFV